MTDRRLFLKGFGGAALASAPVAAFAGQGREQVPIARSYVVNLAETALAASHMPTIGSAIGLVRDPQRRFDPNSIAVTLGPERIGYLPGNQSKLLAPLMDAGFEIRATVTGVTRHPRAAVDLELSVLRG